MTVFEEFKELHDYVKKNYEQGKYQNTANQSQKQWSNGTDTKQSKTDQSDYQMGYDQATKDFKEHQVFRQYPQKAVTLGNELTNHQMTEVADFIKGYQAAKSDLLEK